MKVDAIFERKQAISIHKPPASIKFAPIKHTLVVAAEPFKFSSRQAGVPYELSKYDFHQPSSYPK
jgi:carbonic anhydrase